MVPLCAALISFPLHAQPESTAAPGVAWNVQGAWHTAGVPAPIQTGDPIWPNALLAPDISASAHSIQVLLPDGQSILYQCFTVADCARGFRVPALFRAPDPFAVQMLAHIRAALVRQRNHEASLGAEKLQFPQDEVVAALRPDRHIEIGGLAAKLSDGVYFGDLKSFDARYPEQTRIPLQKSGPTLAFTVPAAGLYLLNITDSRNWPRIDVMIAVESEPGNSIAANFKRERALLSTWIHHDFFGWPIHDFQRAYLESLMLNLPPARSVPPGRATRSLTAGTAAEPTFSPRPGVVSGNLNITLHCATPGATIHYTLGPSQPVDRSPVASAPIVMSTLPMTIKAFASAPGKQDSPVVTANFRVDSD